MFWTKTCKQTSFWILLCSISLFSGSILTIAHKMFTGVKKRCRNFSATREGSAARNRRFWQMYFFFFLGPFRCFQSKLWLHWVKEFVCKLALFLFHTRLQMNSLHWRNNHARVCYNMKSVNKACKEKVLLRHLSLFYQPLMDFHQGVGLM